VFECTNVSLAHHKFDYHYDCCILLQGRLIFRSFLSVVIVSRQSRLTTLVLGHDTRADIVHDCRLSMTAVKMPPVNVGPCVTAFTIMKVSADQRISAREMGLVRYGRRGGIKNVTLWTFSMDEPISRDLSRNLSRKNAKP